MEGALRLSYSRSSRPINQIGSYAGRPAAAEEEFADRARGAVWYVPLYDDAILSSGWNWPEELVPCSPADRVVNCEWRRGVVTHVRGMCLGPGTSMM